MTDSRIIDSHQHVFWHGRDDAGLVRDLDEHGIERAWLLSWEIAPSEDAPVYHSALNPIHVRADGTHPGIPFGDLVRARDRYPERFILGYCPHPLLGDAPARLSSAVRMYDVQVCGEWKFRTLFDDPRCLELFHTAGQHRLPVVLHLDVPYLPDRNGGRSFQPAWYGGTVDNLERALTACPETVFIGHAPGFWREISGDADGDPAAYPRGPVTPGGRLFRLLDTYPNLYADLSAGSGQYALERDPAHAVRFLTRYRHRLLFGRDDYGQALHQLLQTLDLPTEVRGPICSENAERLLGPVPVPVPDAAL
jgi:predicted TIM-barrel fold metal-dependent hydrolase